MPVGSLTRHSVSSGTLRADRSRPSFVSAKPKAYSSVVEVAMAQVPGREIPRAPLLQQNGGTSEGPKSSTKRALAVLPGSLFHFDLSTTMCATPSPFPIDPSIGEFPNSWDEEIQLRRRVI